MGQTSGSFSPLQVPEAQMSLKLIFQRLGFPPFSAFSPLQIKGSPRSFASRLFTLGKTGSFTVSAPTGGAAGGPEPCQDGGLRCHLASPSREEGGAAGQTADKGAEMDPDVEDLLKVDGDDELLYEAESPDEAALVHAAHAYRCTLRGRSADHLLVDLPGIGSLAVQLLHILPFDSNRKRMSVVVRHPLSGEVVVYTKGADSVIMDLSEKPEGKRPEIQTQVMM